MKRQYTQASLLSAALRADFYLFVQAAFPIVSSQETFLRNWHVEAMTYMLERVRLGEIKRLIITVPPRNLKSICASVALPAFALGHDPTCKFICVSYAQSLAEKHASDCRALMQSSTYRRVFQTRIGRQKDTQLEFATVGGGYRLATSVGGFVVEGGKPGAITRPPRADDPGRGAEAR